jgi:hypothetical protein
LIGCVGSVDPPDTDGDELPPGTNPGPNPSGNNLAPAKKLFDDNVYTVLNAKCSGGSCHSETAQGSTLTRFVATDSAKGWETAVNYVGLVGSFTTAAPILTKIDAGHKGVTYVQAEKDKIVEWLAKEVELRNGQPNQPPGGDSISTVVDRLMSQFAGCMTLANFQTANMAAAWGRLQTNQGDQCQRCHINGESAFIANDAGANAFSVVSTKKMYWLQYFTVDLQAGAAAAKVIPNQASFLGVNARKAPHTTHPTFNYPNNAGATAVTNFVSLTAAEIAKGTCQPKPLEN